MMRLCPKCGDYYADQSLAFCFADGTPLVNVPSNSQRWTEGKRLLEGKAKTLRQLRRRLIWRRIALGAMSALVLMMLVSKSYVVETTPAGTIPPLTESISPLPASSPSQSGPGAESPSPSPLPLQSPSPSDSPSPLPSPSPSSSPSLSPSPSPSISPTPSPSPSPSPTPTPAPLPIVVYKIRGRVMAGGQPVGGVRMTLEGSMLTSTTTDGGGNYSFSNLRAGGVYTITPRAPMNFKPSSRSLNNLQRDESADFFAERAATPTPTPTPAPTPTPKQDCSENDQNNALRCLRNFEPRWRSQILSERSKILAASVPKGIEKAEAVLVEVEFQYSFPKPCKAALVTARYVWQISYSAPDTPRQSSSVPRQKIFACGKFLGAWGCH